MYKTVIPEKQPEQLQWPSLCLACAQEVKTDGVQINLPVRTDSPVTFKLCKNCSKKWNRRKLLENAGYVTAVLVLIGVVFLPAARQNHIYGAGAAFWLIALIAWWGKTRRGALSLKAAYPPREGLVLFLPSKAYRDEFLRLNPDAKNKGSEIFLW